MQKIKGKWECRHWRIVGQKSDDLVVASPKIFGCYHWPKIYRQNAFRDQVKRFWMLKPSKKNCKSCLLACIERAEFKTWVRNNDNERKWGFGACWWIYFVTVNFFKILRFSQLYFPCYCYSWKMGLIKFTFHFNEKTKLHWWKICCIFFCYHSRTQTKSHPCD